VNVDLSHVEPPRFLPGRFGRAVVVAIGTAVGAGALLDCASSADHYGAPGPIPPDTGTAQDASSEDGATD
jgi:hypothetical protein